MKKLFIIPARGGSKGVPGKNSKPFIGKPLIHYSIEFAREFATDDDICLSTDSEEIIDCAKQINYIPPFVRPAHLATDTATTYDVVLHAFDFYKQKGEKYDIIVVLQPTSPLRKKFQLQEALEIFNDTLDMVVSVTESALNPYFILFEENINGLLKISKGDGKFTRRQDAPPVFALNGSLYIINSKSLPAGKSFNDFTAVRKYVMGNEFSIDLDTPEDWEYAEYFGQKRFNE